MKNGGLLLVLLFLLSCQLAPEVKYVETGNVTVPLTLLDSATAAVVILKDDQEGFFEKVGITDMLIQMKRGYRDSLDRDQLLSEYQDFLKTEVLDFSEEESVFCRSVFNEIFLQLREINPEIFPKNLQLIKLKGNHYGPGAFYTRERTILIPQGVLKERQRASFYETMLHEIFHIYSRYHPEQRKQLYELIGFKKLNMPEGLAMDEPLKNRLLLNPDGIDLGYTIKLEENQKPLFTIPMLVANRRGYDPAKPNFFDYLDFNLYPIHQTPYSKSVQVLSQENGRSRLDLKKVKGFYEQIQRNTNYIIHPDEILADNFIFMVQAKQDARTLGQFSEEGIKLIEAMEQIFIRQ